MGERAGESGRAREGDWKERNRRIERERKRTMDSGSELEWVREREGERDSRREK